MGRWTKIIAGTWLLSLLGGVSANADVFMVNTFDDHNDGGCQGDCTLREAVIAASGTLGNDTIILQEGTYTLSVGSWGENGALGGDLDIVDELVEIRGKGAGLTIIDAAGMDRVFDVNTLGFGAALKLVDLTIKNGDARVEGSQGYGGGVRVNTGGWADFYGVEVTTCSAWYGSAAYMVNGDLGLIECDVHNNVAERSPIWCVNGNHIFYRTDFHHNGRTNNNAFLLSMANNAQVQIEECTIRQNTLGSGAVNGTIEAHSNFSGSLLMRNTLVLGNRRAIDDSSPHAWTGQFENCTFTGQTWGAIRIGAGNVTLDYCTIVGNTTGAPLDAAGIEGFSAPVTVGNTIVAGNTGNGTPDLTALIHSNGYNLFGNVNGAAFTGDTATNIIGEDPQLAALANNGGWTQTMMPQPGSPVIEAGNPGSLSERDQRNHVRPWDADANGDFLSDIGAVEALSDEGPLDCNGNGIDDAIDIASGTSQDCNGNGVPDICDTLAGVELDLNGNGVPDSCDIADGTCSDCNGNGICDQFEPDCDGSGVPDACEDLGGDCDGDTLPDACEIANGSADCNGNGIPDECEIDSGEASDCNGNGILDQCELDNGDAFDCDGNGVLDECDIANGDGTDCNFNGVLDSCDIANGDATDCNGNGLPDECEIGDPVTEIDLTPANFVNLGNCLNVKHGCCDPYGFTWEDPSPGGIVESVTIEMFIGTSAPGYELVYELNGGQPGTWTTIHFNIGCETTFGTVGTIELHPGDYVPGGTNTFLFTEFIFQGYMPNPDWGADVYARVTVNKSVAVDDNDNGIIDECEADCDGNGMIDFDEIRTNPRLDANGNGILDSCEAGGDVDGDGDVDQDDLLEVLANWGPCPSGEPCVGDANGDGAIGVDDLLAIIAGWSA